MAAESHGFDLLPAVALLGAGVVAVPLFKRLGLGSVIGYLAAGIVIGPFGLGLFTDPGAILHVAELGVVMLLFIIGLELKPSRLWLLRHDIFGLGLAQVVLCTVLLGAVAMLAGLPLDIALVAAMGLALSSTAIVMQILEETGETTDTHGQKIFSILLLQDLAIVPALAVVAFLAPASPEADETSRWLAIGIAVGAILVVILAGRYLLNPVFRFLSKSKAREVMTAAALLVVLGAAYLMQASGLSMAMGAFLAGVLLSESSFRHELEADIEPFRGLLLGLFFLGVGMALDLQFIASSWLVVIAVVVGFMVLKAAAIYGIARAFRNTNRNAVRIALMLAQGGEFGFVLYTTAVGAGILDSETAALLNAAVIVSMALTPLAPMALHRLLPPEDTSFDGVEHAEGLTGTALVVGFGRFGQVASQALLARGIEVSIIDHDTDMIRSAARFGFKIYYGDATRLDVLRAAGAQHASIIAMCIDDKEATDKAVEIIKSEFPTAKVLARSYDRGHSLRLLKAGVDYEIRETIESAMIFGGAALIALGVPEDEAADIIAEVRRRDTEHFNLQHREGIYAGVDHIRNAPRPAPLSEPQGDATPLSEETARLTGGTAPDPVDDTPDTAKA